MEEITKEVVNTYKYGMCYPMAMAMAIAHLTGSPIKALIVDRNIGDSEWPIHPVHLYNESNGVAFDIGGPLDEDEIMVEYLSTRVEGRDYRNPKIIEIGSAEDFIQYVKDTRIQSQKKFLEYDLEFLQTEFKTAIPLAEAFIAQNPELFHQHTMAP